MEMLHTLLLHKVSIDVDKGAALIKGMALETASCVNQGSDVEYATREAINALQKSSIPGKSQLKQLLLSAS